ncbi:MAG TPA: lactate 2-monooxygenase [Solirubrobacteraceae bacterium]|jgi:isopentenyl diphosphate isomerase/L-lactate dehydrogenase-like FMN-dependent dehydrogenase|nr:lactate 2-monooxygenase [Solirubrobacteraceae bacterium]
MPDPAVVPFANFQYEIYGKGALSGERPELPITYAGLESAARERLSPEAFGYVAGGAGVERTVAANVSAFERWELVPRMLRDVSARDLATSVLGVAMPAPVMLAPVGVQSIIHPEAELAVARAAAGLDVPFILSTAASHTIEQVAEAAGGASRWFQLYWPRGRDLASSLVGRAEQAGYGAVVVTLDNFLLSWRPRDLQGAYLPFLKGEGVANYFSDPAFRAALESSPEEDQVAAIGHWATQFPNPGVTWSDLEWLRAQTGLPILLKGILHPDDARRALEHGVDGLVVSNHGGRQVDGAIASLDALPSIRAAVGDELPVLLDSGIRSSADVVKALALGANAVCIGRPYVWGLALAGQAGVEHVLRCLLAELDLTMALTGHATLAELDAGALCPRPRE